MFPREEPLRTPLPDAELHMWRYDILAPNTPIWDLVEVAMAMGATDVYHPAFSDGYVARFVGPNAPVDRIGALSRLVNLEGKFFEIIFTTDGNLRPTGVRSVSFVTPSQDPEEPSSVYELTLHTAIPQIMRLPRPASPVPQLFPVHRPSQADLTVFGGTINALWEEQGSGVK